MSVACLSFVALLTVVAACGEVPAPTTDAPVAIDAAVDAPMIDAPGDATVIVTKTGAGTGTIASAPAGISCGATCSARFPLGSSVTLTATVDVGVAIVAWGGACAGSPGTSCTLTVNADTAVSIELAPSTHTITITTGGNGVGAVVSTPAGLNCGNGGTMCSATFPYGTALTLTPTPAALSLFAGWSGGTCTGLGPCTFTVTGNATANAGFALDNFTLIVAKAGTGTGTVTSSPAGINCGATCAMGYTANQMVTLTATPASDSTFAGWSGACTGAGTCTVTMDGSRMVTATFNLRQFPLTVARAGNGAGTVTSAPAGISCGATCTANYNSGTLVTLTATPAGGSTFAGWSGACTGAGTCVVTVTAAASATATFTLLQFPLTVSKAGAGTGTVTSAPAGIACGATCVANFNSGTVVTLSAAAGAGSTFAGWSGAGCSGTGTCVVTVTAATTATATFNAASTTSTITISKTGLAAAGATVTSSPAGITCGATCSGTFTNGTVVTLTQTVAGSIFNGWSGAGCSGTGACTFTVGAAATVTASYRAARIAISVGATSCLKTPNNSGDRALTLLTARGHAVSYRTSAELNTAALISAFDVIVIGGPGDGCAMIDAAGYDGIIDNYIRVTGGGVVASGWTLFNGLAVPNLYADLPTVQNANYLSGTFTVTPNAGSPITTGLGAFSAGEYVPYGGGIKPGATSLLTVAPNSVGASWPLGNGRTVFLGPMYLENNAPYANENLLDGTQPSATELFLRAVEWAAKAR